MTHDLTSKHFVDTALAVPTGDVSQTGDQGCNVHNRQFGRWARHTACLLALASLSACASKLSGYGVGPQAERQADIDQATRDPAPDAPSTYLNLIGLVKHLAATEHGWFLNRYAGLPDSPPFGDDPDEDFRIGPDETTDGIVDAYLRTCQRAREVVSGGDLDAVMHLAEGPAGNVRALMLHMIQETARHAGHADIMREEIDGTTGI
jgi:hypothetical protein